MRTRKVSALYSNALLVQRKRVVEAAAAAAAAAVAAPALLHTAPPSVSQPKGFVMKRVHGSSSLPPQQSHGVLVDSDQREKEAEGLFEQIGDETDAEELSPLCIR
jgi:hypothetical protein